MRSGPSGQPTIEPQAHRQNDPTAPSSRLPRRSIESSNRRFNLREGRIFEPGVLQSIFLRSWVTGTSFLCDPTYLTLSTVGGLLARGSVRRASGFVQIAIAFVIRCRCVWRNQEGDGLFTTTIRD